MSLSGKSTSTFQNYIRTIASISLYFKKIQLVLSDDQINDYLLLLKEKQNTSYTTFKHYVYALRYIDRDDRAIQLPTLKRNDSIPDIECKTIFKPPKIKEWNWIKISTKKLGYDPKKCPCPGKRTMVIMPRFASQRSPPKKKNLNTTVIN